MKPGIHRFTRREMIGMGVAGLGASLLSACQEPSGPLFQPLKAPVLVVRAKAPTRTATAGTSVSYSTAAQEAFLYLPASYQPSTPTPLVLLLHDENSTAYATLQLFQPHADAAGLALLAVDSYQGNWDIISQGYYGPDVTFINDALAATFDVVNVDPARLSIEGFSAGAAYAIAMGRTNGNLFSRVISFAPGGTLAYSSTGKPKFFMAQGTQDQVFDISQTGRFISQQLITAGYSVDFVEFTGGHEVPDAIVQQAIAWLAT